MFLKLNHQNFLSFLQNQTAKFVVWCFSKFGNFPTLFFILVFVFLLISKKRSLKSLFEYLIWLFFRFFNCFFFRNLKLKSFQHRTLKDLLHFLEMSLGEMVLEEVSAYQLPHNLRPVNSTSDGLNAIEHLIALMLIGSNTIPDFETFMSTLTTK